MEKTGELQASDYRIRKLIGILGLCLPFLLPIVGNGFLASISHYYYTDVGALVFIIILSSFALFLISYKGYSFDKNTEKISDNWVTNIGGIAALIVVILPTRCDKSHNEVIQNLCELGQHHLLGHDNFTRSTIHLVSAGIFLFCMGWMSKYKFPRSSTNPDSLENSIYRICGNIVWLALGLLLLSFLVDLIIKSYNAPKYLVYIMETVAIVPFGVSWLVKGQTMNYARTLVKKFF